MQEKSARLNTLKSADKQDLTAINKVIDEITAIKANLMKKQAAHHADVSKLLTDEQRVHFNARQGERGKGKRMRHQSCQ
jgi:Spy/CpxP family protein refolding chaperone